MVRDVLRGVRGKTRWYLGRIVREREVVYRKFWTCRDVSLFIAIEEETQLCSSRYQYLWVSCDGYMGL
jgi:hypothetical protein